MTNDNRTALHKCLLFMEAFRVVGPIMTMQQVYAFLIVAMDEGRGVQEYADRAGITQPVMTRILFALGPRGQRGAAGYGLVQQAIDTEDSRKHQTFLTGKGKALMREIVRLIRSDDQRALNLGLRGRGLVKMTETSQDLVRDQWLRRLMAAGRKLDADDIQLAVRQIEVLIGHRQSKRLR